MEQETRKAAEKVMEERFGRGTLVALATADERGPSVRTVNAYYEKGSFYVITSQASNKMRQIAKNPRVAIAGDWFSAHGLGADLGWFGAEENREIAKKLKQVFDGWINNGHCRLADVTTRILRVRLTDGVLFSKGTRYDIDFRTE